MIKPNKEITYKNELNTVPLKNFTATEMDLLFSIVSQLQDKELTEIEINFSELKHLSNYNKETAIQSFVDDLEKTYDKLIQLNVKIGTSKQWTKFVFFTKYTVDREEQTVKIRVNSEFAPLINKLTGNFTKLELAKYTQLESIYSKGCYRLLKQFRKTGYYKVDIDMFRYLLDIPESYNMSNLTARVLRPIKNELSQHFKKLKITKVKSKRDKRKISSLEFTFVPETDINKQGYKTFRDKETGEYKEKHIYDFNNNDIEKAFPVIDGQLKIGDENNQ